MPGKKEDEEALFSCSFEISGTLPKEIYNKFVEVQANLLGLRGWIEQTSEGKFKGYLEGKKSEMDKLKQLMQQAENFAALIQQAVFAEFKKIDNWTAENFQVK